MGHPPADSQPCEQIRQRYPECVCQHFEDAQTDILMPVFKLADEHSPNPGAVAQLLLRPSPAGAEFVDTKRKRSRRFCCTPQLCVYMMGYNIAYR